MEKLYEDVVTVTREYDLGAIRDYVNEFLIEKENNNFKCYWVEYNPGSMILHLWHKNIYTNEWVEFDENYDDERIKGFSEFCHELGKKLGDIDVDLPYYYYSK